MNKIKRINIKVIARTNDITFIQLSQKGIGF